MSVKQIFAWAAFLVMTCWGTMAIVFSNVPAVLRRFAGWGFVGLALAAVILPGTDDGKIIYFLAVFAAVLGWWLRLRPSNDRDWRPDVAILPSAEIDGDTVVIRNIRDCDYRSEDDYAVRHYDKTLDLRALRTMDLFLVNWGLKHISHAMLSFGFDGDRYVCVSLETRKKKGEGFSTIRGFFKQYELIYVVADERDVIRLRTDHRCKEETYLYRLKAQPELARAIFLDILRKVERMRESPEWYHALTGSCAIGLWRHIKPYYSKAKFDWRIVASSHADEMAYELGVIDQTFPFQELKRRSHINDRSRAAGPAPEYSRLIRQGLPGMRGTQGGA